MPQSVVTLRTPDSIEITNRCDFGEGQDPPTVFLHASSWHVEGKTAHGIAVEVFGHRAPLISATDARTLAQWLLESADYLERLPNSKDI